MDWATAARRTAAGYPPAASRRLPVLRPPRRFSAFPARHGAPQPRRGAVASRAGPPTHHRDAAAVPDVRHARQSGCGRRALAPGAVAQFEFLLIAAAVAEGWAVSVPDHEGRKGMWGAPYEPGYHVLDGLRAALNSERLGLSPSAPIGLWGYSG